MTANTFDAVIIGGGTNGLVRTSEAASSGSVLYLCCSTGEPPSRQERQDHQRNLTRILAFLAFLAAWRLVISRSSSRDVVHRTLKAYYAACDLESCLVGRIARINNPANGGETR